MEMLGTETIEEAGMHTMSGIYRGKREEMEARQRHTDGHGDNKVSEY